MEPDFEMKLEDAAEAVEPISNEPTIKMEPDPIQSCCEIDTVDWRIKTEEVDISDYEYKTESADSRIKPEQGDVSDDYECDNEPEPVETVYVKEEPDEENKDVQASMAGDPLFLKPAERFESTRERHSLLSTADTSDCSPFLTDIPNKNCPVEKIMIAGSKRFKESCAPSTVKARETDTSMFSVAETEAEKQSVTESLTLTAELFACGSCLAKFSSKTSLTRHVTGFCFKNLFPTSTADEIRVANSERVTFSGETFSCCSCKMRFKFISELERHVRNNPTKRCHRMKCKFCPKVFTDNGSRRKHLLTHTEEKKYECKFCPMRFTHTSNRSKHLLTHTGEKRYECKFCPKRFSQANNRNKHLLTHTGEKTYECTFCPKLFSGSGNRNLHLLTHTGEKKYACESCPKLFSDTSSRNKHLVTHTREKKYACEFCPKLFSQSCNRNVHLLTHTGEKKYACKFCPMLFSQNGNRNSHLLTHTGEKKYACKFCPKRFIQSSNRNKHLLTHAREKKL